MDVTCYHVVHGQEMYIGHSCHVHTKYTSTFYKPQNEILVSQTPVFQHISRATKSMKVAKALSALPNTVREVQPKLMRHAIVACVLLVAYFGAEMWWPDRTRPGNPRLISNRVNFLLALLSTTILVAARATLPVYKTSLNAITYRESAFLTPEIGLLDNMALEATVRLRTLDPDHPLVKHAAACFHEI